MQAARASPLLDVDKEVGDENQVAYGLGTEKDEMVNGHLDPCLALDRSMPSPGDTCGPTGFAWVAFVAWEMPYRPSVLVPLLRAISPTDDQQGLRTAAGTSFPGNVGIVVGSLRTLRGVPAER